VRLVQVRACVGQQGSWPLRAQSTSWHAPADALTSHPDSPPPTLCGRPKELQTELGVCAGSLTQASPKELQAELAAVGAVELAGHWRSVDADYLGQLLELIILRQALGVHTPARKGAVRCAPPALLKPASPSHSACCWGSHSSRA